MDAALLERLRHAAQRAFSDTDVLFAYVFGSVAVRRGRSDSDVDVAVYLQSLDPRRRLDLTLDVGGRLVAASGIADVDLLILNVAPLRLQGRVIQQRVVIYSRDEATRVAYESRTLREFFDFELHARALDRQFLEAIAAGRR